MRPRRRVAVVAALATALLTLAATAGTLIAPASAATPRTSLTAVEDDVMCVSCHEPLALAQSPQAIAERGFISSLVAQGQTKAQIERALVAQYGPAVLAKPPARGFNLTVYILPPAILIAGLVVLALTLPKWRARAKENAVTTTVQAPLAAADSRRLDEDLARFDA